MTNEDIIRAFAGQFTPPLNVVKTERVNNSPIPDAWMAACHDKDRGIGITAIAHSGGLHAYLEAAGKGIIIAADAGRVMAKALGLFKEP